MTEKKKEPTIVYIASPYAGGDAAIIAVNLQFAKDACHYAITEGRTPFAPHLLYTQLLPDDDPESRLKGIGMGMEFLPFCTELWVCGSVISRGMGMEIEQARELGIRIRNVSAEKILHADSRSISSARPQPGP